MPSCPSATSKPCVEQRARYRRARDTLALVLYAPNGALVETSRIDITPDASSSTGLTLEVGIVDEAFWNRQPASRRRREAVSPSPTGTPASA